VGILGGRPNQAYYLIGVQHEYLIFLDPHTTKNSLKADKYEIRKNHMQYHENTAKRIHFRKLDPSLGFAFLLKSKNDFNRFKDAMSEGAKKFGPNWAFHSMDTKPNCDV
jgi:cysteine protease ATG4